MRLSVPVEVGRLCVMGAWLVLSGPAVQTVSANDCCIMVSSPISLHITVSQQAMAEPAGTTNVLSWLGEKAKKVLAAHGGSVEIEGSGIGSSAKLDVVQQETVGCCWLECRITERRC